MSLFQRLSSSVLYEGPRLNHYLDRVRLPSGRIVEAYHRMEIPDAVGAVILNDNGDILLVQSYRYPSDSVEWEFPAGLVDPGEHPVTAAEREALEESGYQTINHRLLQAFHPIISLSGHTFHVYECRAAEKVAEPDYDEVKSINWFTKGQIEDLIRDGEILDGITLTALLLHLSGLAQGAS